MQRATLCLSERKSDSSQDRYVDTKTQQRKDYLKAFLEEVLKGEKNLQLLPAKEKEHFSKFFKSRAKISKRDLRFIIEWLARPYVPFPDSDILSSLVESASSLSGNESLFFDTLDITIGKNDILLGNKLNWNAFLHLVSQRDIEATIEVLYYLEDASRVLGNDISQFICHQFRFNDFVSLSAFCHRPSHSEIYKVFVSIIKRYEPLGYLRLRLYDHFYQNLRHFTNSGSNLQPGFYIKIADTILRHLPKSEESFSTFIKLLANHNWSQQYNIASWIYFCESASKTLRTSVLIGTIIYYLTKSSKRINIFEDFHPNDQPDIKGLFLSLSSEDYNLNLSDEYLAKVFAFVTFYFEFKDLAISSLTDSLQKIHRSGITNPNRISKQMVINCFVKYEIPQFFVENFYYLTHNEMMCFIHIIKGNNIRSYNCLNIQITKKEAHFFINNYDILSNLCGTTSIDTFLYATKLFIAGVNYGIIKEVDSLNIDFKDDVWRNNTHLLIEFAHFLSTNEGHIDRQDVRNIYDFIYAKIQENPEFSLKGRTPSSLLRTIREWHIELTSCEYENVIWRGLAIPTFYHEYEGKRYKIVELKSGKELWSEGNYLHHCVNTYTRYCKRGQSAIFSLREVTQNGTKRLITLEVSRNAIVQAKGMHNRCMSKFERLIVLQWVKENNFRMSC